MIEEFLRNRGVGFEVIRHERAYTAQETAATEHVSGHIFAKSVVVTDGEKYHMLVLPASRDVDFKKADALIGKKVRLATEDEMKPLFSECELGAEPPFGSVYHLPTYVDESLAERRDIVFRAGTHETSIKMRYKDFLDLEKPTVAAFAKP